ncbi:MAG: methionyl aminopeptidase [Lachnospiraceae bacterium]|jgi:methionyl aminopeptidase
MIFGKIGRNDPCWCGSGRKYKMCHNDFDNKLRRLAMAGHEVPGRDIIKTDADIEGIKASAKINITVLDEIAKVIGPGMATIEIDDLVNQITYDMGGIPADLNYEGYPKSVCTSINEVICHGIPSADEYLEEGDIVNVDCSTILNGYFSDSSRMFCIGEVSPEKKKLVDVTKECVGMGLEMVKPWNFLGDMGDVINRHAMKHGYQVVRDIGGHGIGKAFHEEPWVSYVSTPGTEMVMAPGMVFTIEPMINMGTYRFTTDKENGWTVRTLDGLPSAQWEIQVLVTEDGHEVLCW